MYLFTTSMFYISLYHAENISFCILYYSYNSRCLQSYLHWSQKKHFIVEKSRYLWWICSAMIATVLSRIQVSSNLLVLNHSFKVNEINKTTDYQTHHSAIETHFLYACERSTYTPSPPPKKKQTNKNEINKQTSHHLKKIYTCTLLFE